MITRDDVTFNTTVWDQASGVIDIDGGRIIYRVERTGNRPRWRVLLDRQVQLPGSKVWRSTVFSTIMVDCDLHGRIAEKAEQMRKVV